ncbi:MAG: CDP-glycerol glycerophosphotransferase family protein [Coriobacteriia bacterium]|nr:CDP-glycerol glycerophosphotransferase family protein [Coriobacteriia bacterium]
MYAEVPITEKPETKTPSNESQQFVGKKNSLGRSTVKTLKYFVAFLAIPFLFVFSKMVPINPKKVMFMTYSNDYTCNPKYICEELLRRDSGCKIIWAVDKKDSKNIFPQGITLVKRYSLAFFYAQASSKVWVDNALNFLWAWFPKKRGQVLLNTWHGSMGLKRIDKQNVQRKRWKRKAQRVGELTDYCISNSLFEDEVFRETHWPKTTILPYGHARNDALINSEPSFVVTLKKRACVQYGFSENTKIVLYAPTFRESNSLEFYNVDYERLCSGLAKRFGGQWLVMARHHYSNKISKEASALLQNKEWVIDVTDYTDMQELLLIADVGVTDYSSWICDFVLTSKPAFIYASDLEEYRSGRGFYYPLESTPFPLATNNDILATSIESFDQEKYEKNCSQFLLDRGSYEKGTASKRVVDDILQICEV